MARLYDSHSEHEPRARRSECVEMATPMDGHVSRMNELSTGFGGSVSSLGWMSHPAATASKRASVSGYFRTNRINAAA